MQALTFILWLIGLCVGSFLAVLVDRLPRGEDTVFAPSCCRDCKQRLGLRDLIPVVSFLLQRGTCRSCNAAIPPWTLYIELLAGGAAILAVLMGTSVADTLLIAVVLWTLIALGATDLIWYRLPDVLTATLAFAAFALALLPTGIGPASAFWGAIWGAGGFMALRLAYQKLRGREGLGLGDVKLMVGIGALVGPLALPLLVLIAALLALILAASQRKTGADAALPFGACLCLSAAVLLIGSAN